MAGKIKCTYEDCFRHFENVESMRKHKAKDPAHRDFYCKRCDEDCVDDTEYLIHQLSSPKHIACPLCGLEFKSEGGRERHVSINHKAKQSIKCVGCGELFARASGLMAHIEKNKCKAITKEDFQKHKAEQQLEKDAFEDMNGGLYNTALVSGYGSVPVRGPNLLEDQRAPLDQDQGLDWESAAAEDLRRAGHGPAAESVGMLGTITEGMSNLAVNEFPSLKATSTNSTKKYSNRVVASDSSDSAQTNDCPDIKREADRGSDKLPSVTTANTATTRTFQDIWNRPIEVPSSPPSITWNNSARPTVNERKSSGINQLDFDSTVNGTTFSTVSSIATRGTRPSEHNQSMMPNDNIIPAAARPQNQDPYAPYAQVQTQTRLRMPSQLDLQSCWDPIQQCYICPSLPCSRRLKSVKEFQEHLLSGAHTGGTVQCPSCLKRFKTTTALVAHVESGSTRCDLRNSAEFDLMMRSITAGLIKVDGTWSDGSHKYSAVPVDQW